MKGIYMLLLEEEIVYVGKSLKDIKSRVRTHYKHKEFDTIKLYTIENDADISIAEVVLIASLYPIYNTESGTETNTTLEFVGLPNILHSPTVYSRSEFKSQFMVGSRPRLPKCIAIPIAERRLARKLAQEDPDNI